MATKAELISDIELRLTRGKVSDDFELPQSQISYWLDMARDELVTETLNSEISSDTEINPFYIERETCKVTTQEDENCIDDDCFERNYVSVTNDILNLIDDKGVVLVTGKDGSRINGIHHSHIDTLKNLKYSKPSVTNPVFYREGKKLIIEGMGANTVQNVNIDVYYVKALVGSTVVLTDPYLISSELLPELLENVEAIARREMDKERNSEDLINDGTQE